MIPCRLENRRACETFNVDCAGLRYIATVSRFDGRLAEVFLTNGKAGSTSDTAARDSAIIASPHSSSVLIWKRSSMPCAAIVKAGHRTAWLRAGSDRRGGRPNDRSPAARNIHPKAAAGKRLPRCHASIAPAAQDRAAPLPPSRDRHLRGVDMKRAAEIIQLRKFVIRIQPMRTGGSC
jgi:hypothetical protein